jgi:hypothetical protein
VLQYSNLTAVEAYDEILMRLGRFRNAISVDYDTVLNYLNWAVITTLSKSLPYKEWAYVGAMNVQHRTNMPLDYIGFIRVLVSDTGLPPFREARYVAPKEYNQLVNWRQGHSWNQGFNHAPIFTMWADNVVTLTTPSIFSIYLYPNTEDVVGVQPSNLFYPIANVTGLLEYYQAPAFMANDTDRVPIPYEFEDIVIMTVVMRMLGNLGDVDVSKMYMDITEETARVVQRYEEKKKADKRQLDAFQEPVIPLYPPQPQEGEIPQEMV